MVDLVISFIMISHLQTTGNSRRECEPLEWQQRSRASSIAIRAMLSNQSNKTLTNAVPQLSNTLLLTRLLEVMFDRLFFLYGNNISSEVSTNRLGACDFLVRQLNGIIGCCAWEQTTTIQVIR